MTITDQELTALREILATDDMSGPAIWRTLLEALRSLVGADPIWCGDLSSTDRVQYSSKEVVRRDRRSGTTDHQNWRGNWRDQTISTLLPVGPGTYLQLTCCLASGTGFPDGDRFYLTLLRPHVAAACWHAEGQRDESVSLTARQTELLRLVSEGYTNRQIARRMGLAEGTVRKHLNNIYIRLGVSSRTAAVTKGLGVGGRP